MGEQDLNLNFLDQLSQSEIDRYEKQNQIHNSLIDFLHDRIKTIKEEDDIEQEARKLLLQQLQDDEKNDSISRHDLIAIIKLMKEDKTNSTLGILGILKESVKINIDNTGNDSSNPPMKNVYPSVDNITPDEYQELVKLAKLLNTLEHTEKNIDELL